MANDMTVRVGVNNTPFRRGLDEIKRQAGEFRGELNKAGSSLGGIGRNIAGFFAIGTVVEGLSALLDKFGAIQDLSDRYGQSAVALQKVDAEAQKCGTDVETVAKSMARATLSARKMADATKEGGDKFTALGISAEDFAKSDLDGQLIMLAEAYEKANKEGDGAAAIMEILGTKGAAVIPLIAQGPDALRESLAKVPAVGDQTVAMLDNLGDKLTEVKLLAVEWGTGLVANLSKSGAYITWLTDKLSGMGATADEVLARTKADIDEQYFGRRETRPVMGGALDDEDTAEKVEKLKTVKTLREEIADMEQKARLAALDEDERLNAIYAERDELQKKANDTSEEGLKAKKKAMELDEQAKALSTKIMDEQERRGEQIGAKKAEHARELEKALNAEREQDQKNAYDALKTPAEKAAFLRKKQSDLAASAQADEQEAEMAFRDEDRQNVLRARASEKRRKAKELFSEIDSLETPKEDKEKRQSSVVASSLAQVGGGGYAAATADPGVRQRDRMIRLLEMIAGASSQPRPYVPTAQFSGGRSRTLQPSKSL